MSRAYPAAPLVHAIQPWVARLGGACACALLALVALNVLRWILA